MRMFRSLVIAGVLAGASASGAGAADTITVGTSSPVAVPVHDQQGFDWNGFYAGVYGAVRSLDSDETEAGLGIQAGVNARFDFFLVGAEVAVQGLTGGTGSESYGQLLGRAGLVATDDVLVYAAGGYGLDLSDSDNGDVLAGGGVEMALSQSLTLEAEYLHSFPSGTGTSADQITLGANFHF